MACDHQRKLLISKDLGYFPCQMGEGVQFDAIHGDLILTAIGALPPASDQTH